MRACYEGQHAPTVLYAMQHWNGTKDAPGSNAPERMPHVPHYYLGLVCEGALLLAEAAGRQRLAPGRVFLIPPLQDWFLRPPVRGRTILIAFAVRAARMHRFRGRPGLKIDDHEPPQPSPRAWWGIDIPVVLDRRLADNLDGDLRRIGDLWWRDDLGRLRAHGLLNGVLQQIVLWYAGSGDQPEIDMVQDPRLRSAMRAYLESPAAFHTVTDLAATAGMPLVTFKRRFRQAVGETPGAWLRTQRLRRARVLLLESRLPIGGIAEDLGFTDPTAFSRQFRRLYGLTPSEWRLANPPGRG